MELQEWSDHNRLETVMCFPLWLIMQKIQEETSDVDALEIMHQGIMALQDAIQDGIRCFTLNYVTVTVTFGL